MEENIIIEAENVFFEEVGNHDYCMEGRLNVKYKDGSTETLFTYTRGSRHINCRKLHQCTRSEALTVLEKMYYYHDDLKGWFNV